MRTWAGRCWPELGLAAFWVANVAAMLAATVGQTVPFHFIWISLTVFYGYRTWSMRTTVVVLALVCVVTGAALVLDVRRGSTEAAELTEVPLMAAVFLAMVWHARRRRAALARVRKYAAEQETLRRKEREFLRDASHLLRTPVTVARGYTELLQAGAEDEQTRADAEVVLRELDSVSRISSRLLLLTATQLSELLEPAPLRVDALLQQAAQRWGPTTPTPIDVSAEACELVGDWSLLESAVDALVENALRFTDPEGMVRLSCRPQGDWLVVEVADDGAGIADHRLAGVFERRWHPGMADERSGTGLGLAIVKAIVEAHGGTAGIRSVVGRGSTVTLRLPAAGTSASRGSTPRDVTAPF
jgi:two-component system, OmpR family, sensor kinase